MGARVSELSGGPGTKTYGSVLVSTLLDGSDVRIPIVFIRGADLGPCLWVIAGTHGDEIEPIVAAQRLVQDIDPARIRGSIVVVLAANPSAVNNGSRESAFDGKDLNRSFPGDANGTFTDRLAHVLLTAVVQDLSGGDVVVSLHGGGRTVEAARLIEVRLSGDEAEGRSLALARVACNANLGIIVRIEERTGPWSTAYRGTFERALHATNPVTQITVEAGGLWRMNPRDINAHLGALRNVMHSLEMTDAAPDPMASPIVVKENVRLSPRSRGFWVPHVAVGDRVPADALIAEVVDIYGRCREELRAPFDGMVLYLRGAGVVDPESSSLSDQYGANLGRVA